LNYEYCKLHKNAVIRFWLDTRFTFIQPYADWYSWYILFT